MRMVNVGCGRVYHSEWRNLDFVPASKDVERCDIRCGLPFASGSVDVIYHSHVLEHLTAKQGREFTLECRRVLKLGGILRIAVPDLEGLAREYLRTLDDPSGVDRLMHSWLRLELADQLSRSRSGGEMVEFLEALSDAERARVRIRIGIELDQVLASVVRSRDSFLTRLRRAGLRRLAARARDGLTRGLVLLSGGAAALRAYDVGRFRLSGEVHQTVYDSVALRTLLQEAGFGEIVKCCAGESRIPGFSGYGLEVVDGEVRKPDSLFMEGVAQ